MNQVLVLLSRQTKRNTIIQRFYRGNLPTSRKGEGVTSTTPSSTPPKSPSYRFPSPIRPSSPLSPYASSKPFTLLPSPPPFENPILNFSSQPLSAEILIPTNTSNPPTPPPTISDDQDINDIPLSLLHPTLPKKPHKHITAKKPTFRAPFT
ncbi:hypothetical protein H5410_062255 [Solanum commersonii]|uniref:Uncharacterized protein n=1 Tax=Solanum commersonii TaxID=4109 RepID=A0A9J5WA56_SOLCO|nr:hypothetical protein H5410_062255 [Solanum commersonii]